ncbi:MAG: MaoC family dehydratase [Bacteroidetes bacterium]|jgi:acyl dehydratase|nr:MaoC family dehydratase [Bacteroidota bacterium]MBT3751667.1 MaoC family dehydratase [Bacteroidota bacterium]MBT4401250.1 MaoC family dehydratase [Bacteroidota bacterium]MBT4408245.1 MaoC family dehydratase [Bacteroidota bacterium]MBT5425320.1 MaoC family dehydratase [Bacteroidota bacterium]
MSKIKIRSYAEFESFLGKKIGVTEYQKITQDQINLFADATMDHQWIHTDEKRAEKESPFGTTIAHGYLTVSLLAYHWNCLAEVTNVKLQVNYGINQLKFGQPVKVNDEVRIHVYLDSIINLRGIAKAQLKVSMEIKGEKKPAFDALITFLYHFDD